MVEFSLRSLMSIAPVDGINNVSMPGGKLSLVNEPAPSFGNVVHVSGANESGVDAVEVSL